jgi:DNA-binding response OmpR family regulator
VNRSVLIVEDEERLRDLLSANFQFEGYETAAASEGRQALALAEKRSFDLVILDVRLPGMSGLEVCRTLRRRRSTAGIIILTALSDEMERVAGLRAGADDYVSKPFSILELLARAEVILRRTSPREPEELSRFDYGDVQLDFVRFSATRAGKPIELSPREFEILKCLIRHRGETVAREQLLREAWPHEAAPTSRTVDTHIRNVRSKIEVKPSEPVHIVTVAREGYRFVP